MATPIKLRIKMSAGKHKDKKTPGSAAPTGVSHSRNTSCRGQHRQVHAEAWTTGADIAGMV